MLPDRELAVIGQPERRAIDVTQDHVVIREVGNPLADLVEAPERGQNLRLRHLGRSSRAPCRIIVTTDSELPALAWVCRRDGFEPSPACVLRPLAEAMDPLRAGCETVGRWFADDWAHLRAGVTAAGRDLGATDDRVAAAFPDVA